MKPRQVLVHAHIFKNAGTSFDAILRRSFGNQFVDHRDDRLVRSNSGFIQKFCLDRPGTKAFASHAVVHAPSSSLDIQFHTIYFLRHPIERALSVYEFELKQPENVSLGAKMAKGLNFEDYVRWRLREDVPPSLRNQQVIYLAGMGAGARDFGEKFSRAMTRVRGSKLVGIVDNFVTSVEQINNSLPAELKLNLTEQTTENVQTAPTRDKQESAIKMVKDRLCKATFEDLKAANELDTILYEYAKVKVNKRFYEDH